MKLILAFFVVALVGVGHAQSGREPLYLADVNRAMETMMADMNVPPSGDVDVDFAVAMIPHHLGAVAMAQAELTYGRNELLRRIAQGIVAAQLQEVEAMRLALRDGSAIDANPAERAVTGAATTGSHRHAQ